MNLGPVEFVVVGFPENQFKGEIAPALADLVASGTVRILDLVFVTKDADGNVAIFEYDELDELMVLAEIDGEADGLLSDEDAHEAGMGLEPNSSALLLLWEDLWAKPLADALRGAGGVLLGGSRIPHEIVQAAFEGLPGAED